MHRNERVQAELMNDSFLMQQTLNTQINQTNVTLKAAVGEDLGHLGQLSCYFDNDKDAQTIYTGEES